MDQNMLHIHENMLEIHENMLENKSTYRVSQKLLHYGLKKDIYLVYFIGFMCLFEKIIGGVTCHINIYGVALELKNA